MTEQEYKSDILPDRIPVSQLCAFNSGEYEGNHLGADDLFVMDKEQSEFEKQVPTSHVSRSITNKSLEYSFSGDLKIPNLRNDVRILSTKMVGPSSFLSVQVFPRAFQISALHQDDHKVLDYARGWWLDDGMVWCMDRAMFEYARFQNVCADWLSSNTARISNLTATNQFTNSLTAVKLSTQNLSAQSAKISDLTATNLTATNAWFRYLYNNNMTAENFIVDDVSAHFVSADHVTTKTIPLGYEAPEGSLTEGDFRGDYGDVVYVSPEGMYFSPLMSGRVYICENEQEVIQCLTKPFNFKDVYSSWNFGASNPNKAWMQYPLCGDQYQGGTLPGKQHWSYNDSVSSIFMDANSTDYSYFISKEEYSDYDVLIWMRSDGDDDDYSGFIAASGRDGKGYNHTLSFIRSTQDGYNGTNSSTTYDKKWIYNSDGIYRYTFGTGSPVEKSKFKFKDYNNGGALSDRYAASHWFLVVDCDISSSANGKSKLLSSYGSDTGLSGEYGSDVIGKKWDDGSIIPDILRYDSQTPPQLYWSWTTWGRTDGTLLSVQRRGNVIKALTTKFEFVTDDPLKQTINSSHHYKFAVQPSESKLGFLISVDLGSDMFDGDLAVFRNSSPIGFSTHSQTNTYYKILKFDAPRYIYNTVDGSLKYYPIGSLVGTDVVTDDKYRFIGVGKFVTNQITGKTFYVSDSSVQRVMGQKAEGKNFSIKFDEEGGVSRKTIAPMVFY